MKKILKPLAYISSVLSIMILTGFINKGLSEEKCAEVIVDITDEKRFGFISEGDVIDILNREFNTPVSQKVSEIRSHDIEKRLLRHQAIRRAEVYVTIDGRLMIKLWQRRPILRVFAKNSSFYIDEGGEIMPLMPKFTAHVPVASGEISLNEGEIQAWLEGKNDGESLDTSLYNNLFKLARFVDGNRLWRAQIEQVYVDKDSRFDLSPRVGNHTIVLGEVHDLEEKFDKLLLFYEEGLSKTGWNEYRKIDLTYKNQVVCTKRY